jgi:anti-sigma B factor antagonist
MTHDELTIDRTDAKDGRIEVFGLRGSLDIATAKSLRDAMIEAGTSGDRDVVVDLRGVEFIDSTGLGALIGAHKRVAEHHRMLRLVTNDGPIERLLNITGLIRVFALYRSVEDAVEDRARVGSA